MKKINFRWKTRKNKHVLLELDGVDRSVTMICQREERTQGWWALTNQGIHHIDLLRYLNGEIKSVKAIMRTLGSKIEVEDTALATLHFKNGSIGTLEITTAARPDDFEASISFLGSKGMAQLGGVAVNNLDIYTPDDKCVRSIQKNFQLFTALAILSYIKILKFYKNRKSKVIEKNDCLKTIELLNSFYVSSELNKEICLGKNLQSKNLGKNEKISNFIDLKMKNKIINWNYSC